MKDVCVKKQKSSLCVSCARLDFFQSCRPQQNYAQYNITPLIYSHIISYIIPSSTYWVDLGSL